MTKNVLQHEIGILTLAIPKDFRKAIGLALTLKEHNPNLSISVVCPESISKILEPFFDQVIIEFNGLRGFEHKIYLDKYSPYNKTFFLDSDILVFKDIMPMLDLWHGSSYAVTGHIKNDGISSFGLDIQFVLKKLNKQKFMNISGAGHAYFEKPASNIVFDTARDVMKHYAEYGAQAFADEDVMGITMTMLDIEPKNNINPADGDQFLGGYYRSTNKSFIIDTDKKICKYEDRIFGKVEPAIAHFPHFTAPFIYARELRKTYKRHNVKIKGLYKQPVAEYWKTEVNWKFKRIVKKILGLK